MTNSLSDSRIDPKEELLIVSHVTQVDSQSLQLGCFNMTKKQQQQVDDLIEKRLKGFPIDYVLGEVEFFNTRIGLSQDVLIPRCETEILVERCVETIQNESHDNKIALDLCTGSGCIGLSLKKACPSLRVILSDVSPAALEVARENGKKNKLDVECILGHLFTGIKEVKIDYLLCNPPYIPESEYQELDLSVKEYEPKLALQGGEDGLMFFRMIELDAKNILNPGAKCFFEIGYNQGDTVNKIFSDIVWEKKKVFKDYAGHDRFFFLEFSP